MPRIRGETKKVEMLSLEEAVKKYMQDDMIVAWGGFTGLNRNPMAFAWETVRQGIKNLHCLDRHGSACTWLLNAVGAMKIYETDWMGWGEMAGKLDINLNRQYLKGDIILEDYSHGAMAMRFLAGAIGAPFIPYYGPLGSDLYNPKYDALGNAGLRDGSNPKISRKKFVPMDDPFFEDGLVNLVPAARPDIGIIHVAQAGEKGTARWRGISTIDKELVFACDKIVLTCEELVPESELRKNPESNQIPYFTVDAVVEVPYGGYPSAVPFYYDYDTPFLRGMDAASRDEAELKKWVDEWIFGPANWRELLIKVGAEVMLDIKADSLTGYSVNRLRGKKPAPRMTIPISVARTGY